MCSQLQWSSIEPLSSEWVESAAWRDSYDYALEPGMEKVGSMPALGVWNGCVVLSEIVGFTGI